jgi:UDP-N-acetylglucosamine diphosphorylase/glucosamine-1-phosphate N-acetyltransferase
MPSLMLFDDGLGQLAPLTDFRASFDIRTGAKTTFARTSAIFGQRPDALFVPEILAALTGERHSDIAVNHAVSNEPALLVNGRCTIPSLEWMQLSIGEGVVEMGTGELVAACVAGNDAKAVAAGNRDKLKLTTLSSAVLMNRPWHVRSYRDAAIRNDLARLTAQARPRVIPGVTTIGGNPISIHESAKVSPGVILDADAGPIFIDEDAVIRPGAIVIGPVYVGPHVTVLDRCLLKSFSSIGPFCKIAGEVGGTIFQGYANKAHDGHLGDSWVGEWANLGAGTTNSNLLNTYDQVICRATPSGPNERTGEQFLGAIIGDHVKFAICTRIMTGSILHAGCMFAQSAAVSGCVGAFTWATDAGSRNYRLDKFVEVARAAMARRKITPSEAYLARLGELHAGSVK